MTPHSIAADLACRLAAATPHGLPEPMPTQASLTRHLGLDSLVLMSFLADVRVEYGVDLGEWLIHQAAHGHDSLGTLAVHLAWSVGEGAELCCDVDTSSCG